MWNFCIFLMLLYELSILNFCFTFLFCETFRTEGCHSHCPSLQTFAIIKLVIFDGTWKIKLNNTQVTVWKESDLILCLKVGVTAVQSFLIWKLSVNDAGDLSDCDVNPRPVWFLWLSFQCRNTSKQSRTQTQRRYADAHTLPASLSSLGWLHCFTADCEDCTKWSWWSLYFPFQLANQFHILSPPPCLTHTPTPSLPNPLPESLCHTARSETNTHGNHFNKDSHHISVVLTLW